MSGAADALGTFWLVANFYFLLRYGPCGVAPIPIPECQAQDPNRVIY